MTTKWYIAMTQPQPRANQAAGVFVLAGPFETQDDAAKFLSEAAIQASLIDGANVHNGFGVASFERETQPAGPLNKRLGLPT